MFDLFLTIFLFIIFILGAISYYVWFWKSNRLWMLLIAINSQTAAFNALKEIIPNNIKQLYRWVHVILGLTIMTIMYVRYWKVNKNKKKNSGELN